MEGRETKLTEEVRGRGSHQQGYIVLDPKTVPICSCTSVRSFASKNIFMRDPTRTGRFTICFPLVVLDRSTQGQPQKKKRVCMFCLLRLVGAVVCGCVCGVRMFERVDFCLTTWSCEDGGGVLLWLCGVVVLWLRCGGFRLLVSEWRCVWHVCVCVAEGFRWLCGPVLLRRCLRLCVRLVSLQAATVHGKDQSWCESRPIAMLGTVLRPCYDEFEIARCALSGTPRRSSIKFVHLERGMSCALQRERYHLGL